MAFLGALVARTGVLSPGALVDGMGIPVMGIPEIWDLTTVAEDEVVFHLHSPDTIGADAGPGAWSGPGYEVITGLKPGTRVVRHGIETRTLDRPGGELLCRFATVNDVHFGETECGTIGNVSDTVGYLAAGETDEGGISAYGEMFQAFLEQLGPVVVRSSPEGATPYPEVMSRAAVSEINEIDPAAVVVKGDVTASGLVGEYDAFLQCYLDSFGDGLLHVRGNHDAFTGRRFASEPCQELVLPGVTVAVLDTVIEGRDSGQVRPEQLDWLDELGARADRPVLVFGHHHVWKPRSANPSDDFFGINPEDSEDLVRVIARRPTICGYFAGHTHRNQVRHFAETGDVPFAELASVKDFPGSWAEYRVFEGGILQVHRRLSSSAALAWSEQCRALFWGMYPAYAMGRLQDRCFPILPRNA
jgi:predicted phosphodiesterase